MEPMPNIGAGNSNPPLIESALAYGEWEYTYPFFVGQTILCSATASQGTSPVDVERTITSIQYNLDNTATPPTGGSKVFITLDAGFFTNGEATATGLTDILFKAKVDDTSLRNTINRAELVLFTRNDLSRDETADEYDYMTFSTEEDNGNGIANFNRSYMLEPECENFVVACPGDGDILPASDITSYRYAIDNVEQTGNRDVAVRSSTAIGSPMQYERLIRALDVGMRMPLRNAQLQFYNQLTTQLLAYDKPISVIVETTTRTPAHKMLNLSIVSPALRQLILYKQLPRNIKV